MKNRESSGYAAALLAVLWAAGAIAGTSPTPAEIVAAWNAMSGGLTAKVVYWRDVDGTDDGAGAICVMNLNTGTETALISQLDMGGGNFRRIRQSNSWGPFPCWSPDGTRIYFFNSDNDWSHWVMNADGSNPKRIGQIDDGGYWLASWYDNASVVYNDTSTVNSEVVRIRINASNDPIQRIVLIADPPAPMSHGPTAMPTYPSAAATAASYATSMARFRQTRMKWK